MINFDELNNYYPVISSFSIIDIDTKTRKWEEEEEEGITVSLSSVSESFCFLWVDQAEEEDPLVET